MAGIYIEGMKMPKLGELLVIEIHPNGKVSYNLDLKSREIAKAIPAADVVEVVRCRECIYNRGETKDLWGNPAIKCVTAVTHDPDWYCASGKRKDGGHGE